MEIHTKLVFVCTVHNQPNCPNCVEIRVMYMTSLTGVLGSL